MQLTRFWNRPRERVIWKACLFSQLSLVTAVAVTSHFNEPLCFSQRVSPLHYCTSHYSTPGFNFWAHIHTYILPNWLPSTLRAWLRPDIIPFLLRQGSNNKHRSEWLLIIKAGLSNKVHMAVNVPSAGCRRRPSVRSTAVCVGVCMCVCVRGLDQTLCGLCSH